MVKPGDTYRKVIGDANCLIEVESIDGNHVLGVVVDEPITLNGITLASDNAGQQVSDLLDDVKKKIAGAKAWDKMVRRQNAATRDFWETLHVGDVIHYRNFPNEFYRGVAVRQVDGQMAMQITALVGNWSKNDLPKRGAYGQIHAPYPTQMVQERRVIRPNASLIFESPTYSEPGKETDPRTMNELDLTIPDPTPEEQARIDLELLLRQVREASEGAAHPQERLDKVKALLG